MYNLVNTASKICHGVLIMKDSRTRFTLRTSAELLDKFGYVAEFNGRTKNKELEQMMKAHIKAFEKKYGEIPEDVYKNTKDE